MQKFNLMIARFPGQNQEHPDSAGYVMELMGNLAHDERLDTVHLWHISDTPITMGRNRCVKEALARGIDYLLMIDSDMSPDCEPGAPQFWGTAWEFMIERRKKEEESGGYISDGNRGFCQQSKDEHLSKFAPATVAAPYCGPPPHEQVYVLEWDGMASGDADQQFRLKMIDRDFAARKRGISEVATLPTGLILYDMRVFQKLPVPWFRYEWTDEYETHKATTEDIYQTRNASLMGMPQFCAWDCWAGHVKSKTVSKPRPLTVRSMRHEFAEAVIRERNMHK